MARIAAILILLMLGSPMAGLSFGPGVAHDPRQSAFVCPMHPDVRSNAAGTCAKCGMPLVPTSPSAEDVYRLDLRTIPETVSPGRPFQLVLTVRDAAGAVVHEFVEVHERRFHLFVISRSLEHYAHLHPEQRADGSWSVDLTVPYAGYYKIYTDFFPEGGAPQALAQPVVVARIEGVPEPSPARLTPDAVLRKTVDSMTVSLQPPDGGFVAGRMALFSYQLTDTGTQEPVTDIEPYLGAWGHSLVMSEDMNHVIHAHPIESLHHGTGANGGGPTLTFQALLPEAGSYRIWTQIKRRGQVSTAIFTVAVSAANPKGRSESSADAHRHRHGGR